MGSTIPDGARPLRLDTIGVERQGDMATIYESATGRLLLVNETGLRVLDLCDGTRDLLHLSTDLAAHFSAVSNDVIAKDIEGFVAQLYSKGVVTWATTP